MHMKNCISLIVILICLFVSASARTIIVPDQFSSVSDAVKNAVEGDTVFIKNGIYNDRVTLSDSLVLIGENIEKTQLWGIESKPVIVGADYCVIKNMTIKGGGTGILSENKKMIIENNIISDNVENGIHCLISLPIIRNNVICRNLWTGIYCQRVRGSRARIEHNIIAESGYSGITTAGRTEIIIENNIIFDNDQFGIFINAESRRTRIEFNCFYKNRKQVNALARINNTNVSKDPFFPPLGQNSYDYLRPVKKTLEGLGKSGDDIGIVNMDIIYERESDIDKDGIDSKNDNCPNMAEDMDGFEDTDGCPDFDNDGDGIFDAEDTCPNEKEDFDDFEDTDGCPDPDNDNDGIVDTEDTCPNKAETRNGFLDDDGCPDEKPEE